MDYMFIYIQCGKVRSQVVTQDEWTCILMPGTIGGTDSEVYIVMNSRDVARKTASQELALGDTESRLSDSWSSRWVFSLKVAGGLSFQEKRKCSITAWN